MYGGYKFRIYPTHEQKILLNKSFGYVRFVFNHYLEEIKSSNKYRNANDCIKDYVNSLKYKCSFLQEVDSIIRKSLFNLLGFNSPRLTS